jgi:hypothetical protein
MIMATIPRISSRKYNLPEYRKLYTQAYDTSTIFMVILDRIKYSKIEYDIATVRPDVTLSDIANNQIVNMYDEYVKSSGMNRLYYSYTGGRRNLIMTVKRRDAEGFARKLYKYIADNHIRVKK